MSLQITISGDTGEATGADGSGYMTLSSTGSTVKLLLDRRVVEVQIQPQTNACKIARQGTEGSAMGSEAQVIAAGAAAVEIPIEPADRSTKKALYFDVDTAPTTIALSWYSEKTGA